MMYEKIKRLAAAEGISIASLEKKLNIGNGTIRKWNEASPTFENAPDLGLEHKIRTLCRNNSAEYHVPGDPNLAAGEEKSN